MDPIAQSLWRQEFARKAAVSREQEERLRDDKRLRDKRDRDRQHDAAEDGADVAMIFEVLATKSEIAEFQVKLDHYDAATVEALMANEQDLAIVRERIEMMLLEAHVLDDGRRVFKTRDGSKVFDEFGAELAPEQVDPQEIDDRKPRWEDWIDAKETETRLVEEREQLIEYQQKLDGARERMDDPDLTKDELEALDAELGEAMLERVRTTLERDGLAPENAPALGNAPAPKEGSEVESTPDHRSGHQVTAAVLPIGP